MVGGCKSSRIGSNPPRREQLPRQRQYLSALGTKPIIFAALCPIIVHGLWFFVHQSTSPGQAFPNPPGGGRFFLIRNVATDNRHANLFMVVLHVYFLWSPIVYFIVSNVRAWRALKRPDNQDPTVTFDNVQTDVGNKALPKLGKDGRTFVRKGLV